MHLIDLVLVVAGLPVLGAALYLLALTVLWRRGGPAPASQNTARFVVLVPAHNEERGIARTLEGLRGIGYPASRWRPVVVADNCTDGTVREARRCGVEVIERQDPERRGKGFALQFAIRHLLAEPVPSWDAMAVVDADTNVSANLLTACAARLEAGERAVQVSYLPAPGGTGPLATITEVAFTAFHIVRSGARERLGLSSGLRGNGMAFTRELLSCTPHEAFSRTEDVEFGVHLGVRGIRVAYAPEARVWGDMPVGAAAAAEQRTRWIGGRTELARRLVPALAVRALRQRSALLADLAVDLVVPPLSVLALGTVLGVLVAGVVAAASGAPTPSLAVWSLAALALGLHVTHAARLAGRGAALLRATGALPGYILRKTLITVRSLAVMDGAWVRTLRQGETR